MGALAAAALLPALLYVQYTLMLLSFKAGAYAAKKQAGKASSRPVLEQPSTKGPKAVGMVARARGSVMAAQQENARPTEQAGFVAHEGAGGALGGQVTEVPASAAQRQDTDVLQDVSNKGRAVVAEPAQMAMQAKKDAGSATPAAPAAPVPQASGPGPSWPGSEGGDVACDQGAQPHGATSAAHAQGTAGPAKSAEAAAAGCPAEAAEEEGLSVTVAAEVQTACQETAAAAVAQGQVAAVVASLRAEHAAALAALEAAHKQQLAAVTAQLQECRVQLCCATAGADSPAHSDALEQASDAFPVGPLQGPGSSPSALAPGTRDGDQGGWGSCAGAAPGCLLGPAVHSFTGGPGGAAAAGRALLLNATGPGEVQGARLSHEPYHEGHQQSGSGRGPSAATTAAGAGLAGRPADGLARVQLSAAAFTFSPTAQPESCPAAGASGAAAKGAGADEAGAQTAGSRGDAQQLKQQDLLAASLQTVMRLQSKVQRQLALVQQLQLPTPESVQGEVNVKASEVQAGADDQGQQQEGRLHSPAASCASSRSLGGRRSAGSYSRQGGQGASLPADLAPQSAPQEEEAQDEAEAWVFDAMPATSTMSSAGGDATAEIGSMAAAMGAAVSSTAVVDCLLDSHSRQREQLACQAAQQLDAMAEQHRTALRQLERMHRWGGAWWGRIGAGALGGGRGDGG